MWCRWHKSVTNAVQILSRHVTGAAAQTLLESKLMRGFVASPAVLFKSGFHRRTEVTTVIPQAFPLSAALFAALGSLTTVHGTDIFAHSCACY